MNKHPGTGLPPELGEHIPPEERGSLELTWSLAGGDQAIEEHIPNLGAQMRTFLRAEGLLQDTPAPKTGRLLFLRPAEIFRLNPWKGYTAIAAVIAVLLAIGITLDSKTLDAPYGEHATYELADGTTLLLNSGTRVRMAPDFGTGSRNVEIMRGEVLFDVEPGTIPFRVKTPHGLVEVLGTKFNVRYWPTDAESATAVAVESGNVRFTDTAGQHQFTLGPGDVVKLDSKGQVVMHPSATDADNQLSWVNRSFKFSDHPTGDILEELERRYDVNVQVDVDGLERTRSGILLENPQGPGDVLADLCELHRCEFSGSSDGHTYTITLSE